LKTKGLTSDNDPSTPEEIHSQAVLEEQREILWEKLVECAVGTQSNTVEGVKRATVSAYGNPLPIASKRI